MSENSLRKPFFVVPKNSWEGSLRRETLEYAKVVDIDNAIALGDFTEAENQIETLAATEERIHTSTLNTFLGLPTQELAVRSGSHEMLDMLATEYYEEGEDPFRYKDELIEMFHAAEASYGEYGTLLESLVMKSREMIQDSEEGMYVRGAISETAILALFARTMTLDLHEAGKGEKNIDSVMLAYMAPQEDNHGKEEATDIIVRTSTRKIPVQIKTVVQEEHHEQYDTQKILLLGLKEVAGQWWRIDNHPLIHAMLDELAGKEISGEDEQLLEESTRRLKQKVTDFLEQRNVSDDTQQEPSTLSR